MNKQAYIFLALLILVTSLSFYAGKSYGTKSATATSATSTDITTGNFRQAGSRTRSQGQGAGLIAGKIISKNEQNIVIQLRDGGSKIVFIGPTAEISKFVPGTAADLEVDKNVSVMGEANPDGTMNAKTVQLRSDIQLQLDRTGTPTSTNGAQ